MTRSGRKTAIVVGGLSGGLVGYYLTRNKPWATLKKFAAVAAGALGGGLVGYGVSRIPSGRRALRAHG